jgi:hypothetical protein
LRDCFASTLSLAFGLVLGHPLDTIKVRIQTAKTIDEAKLSSVIRRTIVKEGSKGFMKGLVAPLIGRLPYNSSALIIKEALKRNL